MDNIHTDKLKRNTADYLMTSVERTRAHTSKLHRSTGDDDGYHDVMDFLDDLEEHMQEFFGRTLVD